MSAALRVGIVGARRVRQGLGPFVARDLEALGAEVAAVLGRSEPSARAAAEGIAALTGRTPLALDDPERFDAEDLDIVCVLTPKGHHLAPAERALDRGRHVLVEKPLLWRGPDVTDGHDWGARAAGLEARAAARGLVLEVNAQWPATLAAYEELHGPLPGRPGRLEMGLAPAARGREMIGDALPHPISLALALRPDLDTVEEARWRGDGPDGVRLEARLAGGRGVLELIVHLEGGDRPQPRPAWFAVDGARADRCVRPRDYALFLRDGPRIVDMPDPLRLHLGAFLREVARAEARERAPRAPRPAVGTGTRLLQELDAAWGPGREPSASGGP